MSDFENFYINKFRIECVVLLYNFKIIFYEKRFENRQGKHKTKLISFQTQCNVSTFKEKLFKAVFKSCRFDFTIIL